LAKLHVLKELSLDDDMDIYDMLQEIPRNENGFNNVFNGCASESFKEYLLKNIDMGQGIGLADWMVPQTTYWLYVEGKPVGMGRIRPILTDRLREEGGNIAYAIRKAERGKGYGSALLKLLINEAAKLNLDRVLITVENENTPSIKVALANGGVIEKVTDLRNYIWIEI
jgi:predicted acetyltransferase